MEINLAELVLLGAVVALLYRLLKPLQEFLEEAIRRLLDPERRKIIDARPVDSRERKFKE